MSSRASASLPGDVVSGLTVALVLVPQSLAYAQLAGMPSYRGLLAAATPPIAAALLASSPYLQTGPVALTSLLTFGALAELAPVGSAEYVSLGILLALVVGVTRLLTGMLRAGEIAYLISKPVLLGFIPAAAILIVASQLPAALGTSAAHDGVLEDAARALAHPDAWEAAAIVLALAALLLLVAGPKIHRFFPAVLVAVVAGIVYSRAADYGGAEVGSIPSVYPSFPSDLPWSELPSLLAPGVIIALVGFIEPSAIGRSFAALERRRWDADREFMSQGAANLAAGLSGGFPVGGSFSRSALNRLAGARTRLSGAVTGVAVLAFLPFASVLAPLPKAVLAAIVIGAVAGLVRLLPPLRLLRYSKPQFGVALATFALTLALSPHIERAVLIGVGLAVALHLWRERSLEVQSWMDGSDLHLRPRGVLWFGTERRLEDAVLKLLAEHPRAQRIVVHLDSLGRIDLTGALALRGVLEDAGEAGLATEIVDVRPRWQGLVARVIQSPADPLERSRG